MKSFLSRNQTGPSVVVINMSNPSVQSRQKKIDDPRKKEKREEDR